MLRFRNIFLVALVVTLAIAVGAAMLLSNGPAVDVISQSEASDQAIDHTRAEAVTVSDEIEREVIEIVMKRGDEYIFVNDPVGVHVEPGTMIRFVVEQATHTATAYHPDFSLSD
ncbi:MAG: hypothetical protein EA383_17540 [Spirochaetaceae bacterium]|nr:MAG: hypothetical protein EA383_17540 [Spirochaetaceae bacterium]